MSALISPYYTSFTKNYMDENKLRAEILELHEQYFLMSQNLLRFMNIKKRLKTCGLPTEATLEEIIVDQSTAVELIEKKLKSKRMELKKISEELGPTNNLKHVVYGLMQEHSIEEKALAKKIDCDEAEIESFLNQGIISNDTFVKLCIFFNLDVSRYQVQIN